MSTSASASLSDPVAVEAPASLWQDAWRRMLKNKMAVFSLFYLIAITIVCIVGPWISAHDANMGELSMGAVPPNATHWFGTDDQGRDLMARTMEGGRVSLGIGIVATVVALLIGVTYGAVAGYVGGKVDDGMMRAVDILYALPFTIFVILLMTVFERSLVLLFVAIGAVEWLTMSRIVRGQVLALKKQEFIAAAQCIGVKTPQIIFRHVLPNVLGPVIVYTTLTVPAVMLLESVLSFLGLGVQAPASSWGSLIKDGADKMGVYPWLLIFPALFFSMTLFALNFLGDGLRDALDPKASAD